jgi:hypothetical protein
MQFKFSNGYYFTEMRNPVYEYTVMMRIFYTTQFDFKSITIYEIMSNRQIDLK